MASDKKQPDGQKFALESAKQQALWQREFQQIVADVQGQALGPNWTANSSPRNIGLPLPRNDVLYKVRGTARYAANISMDGMLYGRFVRSQEPHARILNIDVSAATQAPGVHAILTADEIPQDRLLVGTHDNDIHGLQKLPDLPTRVIRMFGPFVPGPFQVVAPAHFPGSLGKTIILSQIALRPVPAHHRPEGHRISD